MSEQYRPDHSSYDSRMVDLVKLWDEERATSQDDSWVQLQAEIEKLNEFSIGMQVIHCLKCPQELFSDLTTDLWAKCEHILELLAWQEVLQLRTAYLSGLTKVGDLHNHIKMSFLVVVKTLPGLLERRRSLHLEPVPTKGRFQNTPKWYQQKLNEYLNSRILQFQADFWRWEEGWRLSFKTACGQSLQLDTEASGKHRAAAVLPREEEKHSQLRLDPKAPRKRAAAVLLHEEGKNARRRLDTGALAHSPTLSPGQPVIGHETDMFNSERDLFLQEQYEEL
ncbi:hypothetical protein B0T10DRAFT_459673 [Thelonectria olida]|uniref:Uncharacterized protein n=1 Tax=Thelonectria olida TaxID=1576542 RepID=A0A9P8W540_9HYPO|nr:hypothetical protein B0T10DRAFT_459673 [Thelonectria olida]